MSYHWVEHTAELELEIDAPTEEAVFTDALLAIAELLGEEAPSHPGEAISVELSVFGDDRALLLADWLDELVFRAETEDLVPQTVERLELGEGGLTTSIRAVRGNPRHFVKGVTHHRLTFVRSEADGFHATVVLDV
jgi:SHS2 domain-containing protein